MSESSTKTKKAKKPKQKEVALNRPVHNRDMEYIDALMDQFKNGPTEGKLKARNEILKYFEAYIEKYVLLFGGTKPMDLSNYDIKVFLSMFLTGRPKRAPYFYQQLAYIRYTIINVGMSKEDVRQELYAIFLTVLEKHKIKEGVNALNPLIMIFKYRTKDWFNKLAREMVTNEGDGDVEAIHLFHTNPHLYFDKGRRLADIDFINGVGVIEFFKDFAPFDRYLFLLKYRYELSVNQIKALTLRDSETINLRFRIIEKKVRENYSSLQEALEGFEVI